MKDPFRLCRCPCVALPTLRSLPFVACHCLAQQQQKLAASTKNSSACHSLPTLTTTGPHESQDRNPRRRRHRPRSHPRSRQHPPRRRRSSAATTSPSPQPSSAASPSPPTGTPLPHATIDVALESDAVLLGAVGDNKFNALTPDKRPEAGLLQIRQALGGFANLRPSFAYPALAENSPLRPEVTEGVDILFVRELLGGLYFGQPRWWNKETGEAINTMRYTTAEVARVARVAFELASKRRKKVTSVDKANVLEFSQLWRATVNELQATTPTSPSSTSSSTPWPCTS